jgi:hypothetical protein
VNEISEMSECLLSVTMMLSQTLPARTYHASIPTEISELNERMKQVNEMRGEDGA